MNSRALVSACVVLAWCVLARAADQLIEYPLAFPRGRAMGGTGMSYGGSDGSVYANPAWAGSFRRLCLTFPGASVSVDNSFFSFLAYMAQNSEQFDSSSGATEADQNAFFADSVMRRFDGKWFGISSEIVDFSFLVRGFGLLFRNRFSADFSANRGLLFPFMLAEYGQERELLLVYGRKFANDHVQVGAGVKVLQQQKRVVSLPSTQIGRVGDDFWSLSESDWRQGLGLDLGVVGNIPGRRHAALSVRDIGLKTREQGVPQVSLGYAREIRSGSYEDHHFVGGITGAAEYVNIAGSGPPLSKLKLGGEIEFNLFPRDWLSTYLRSGFDGGYITFGAGIRVLKAIVLDYVTSAEETGGYVGQDARRKHLFFGKIQVDFNRFKRGNGADVEVLTDEAPLDTVREESRKTTEPMDTLPGPENKDPMEDLDALPEASESASEPAEIPEMPAEPVLEGTE
ncbi:MAG: hypothetical protein GF418_04185 [Chitinivibrionales bacterium]|nr:hypothetical protein [Chitinivibrionales bacterium]MBD3394806.1 hypothetical protein [Chitinivibrionales bacterium]